MQYALLESYEPTGKIGNISYGNGIATAYGYDSLSTRLTSIITNANGAAEILNKAYTYTPAGDIASITDTQSGVTYSYTYDRLHRLTSETNDGPSDNFAQATLVSTYDDQYRPLHAPASITYNWSEHNYTYDANGNLTSAPDFSDPFYISFPRSAYNSITYNADNMPIRIENRKDDGAMVSTLAVDFNYDGNGTRAKKALSTGDTTYYIGDHFEVANGEEVKYIFAGNQRIAKITTGNSYFYHKDHLGSSSVMTDYPAGATVETTAYLPFGHDRDHTGADVTDYKFTDQEKDTETGLYNYDARMYDPVVGRFISPDSIVQDWYDPQSLNRYAYCLNNPLKYVDPTGHASWPTASNKIKKGGSTGYIGYYGNSRKYASGDPKFHSGVDIPGKKTDTAKAFKKGTVSFADNANDNYGNKVILKHTENVNGDEKVSWSIYSHLSEINVEQGAEVKERQPVGKMGDTGNANDVHLHFETRTGENYGTATKVNPSDQFTAGDKVKQFFRGIFTKKPAFIPETNYEKVKKKEGSDEN